MTVEELQWMTELFRVKKMSKAAENLFISQPALTQCVQRIEKQLGFKLFERSNKGLEPTQKGKLFYEAAMRMTNAYNQFLYQVELLDQQQIQEIIIGMAPFLSYCCSVSVLSSLRNHFPDINFQIKEASTADLLEALQRNDIQLVIIHEGAKSEGLKSHPFGEFPCGIFLRKGSPIAQYAYEENGNRFLDPVYLAEEPLSLARKGAATRIVMEKVLQEAGITPKIVAESSHITTRYRYALEGFASTISPINGEVIALDRQQSESIVYRIPLKYEFAFSRLTICAFPDIDRRIPQDVFSILSECILNNDKYCIQQFTK